MVNDNDCIDSPKLGELFSTKVVFYIPNYQRNYSWEKRHVRDFFNDVYDQVGGKNRHYFGMIMTLTKSRRIGVSELELIDGQQRIITSIIFLVCIRDIFHELNPNLIEGINSEIFNDMEQNSKLRYKIIHDNWDDSFFCNMLDDLPEINNEIFYNLRGEIPTDIYNAFYKNNKMPKKHFSKFSKCSKTEKIPEADVLLKNAYMTIREEIAEKIIEQLKDPKIKDGLKTPNDYKKFVINFLCKLHDAFVENCFISNIPIRDEGEVYSTFNGINNRGLGLSTYDTVKNWILYHIYKENLKTKTTANNKVIQRWKHMEKNASKGKLNDYIFHYLITYHSKKNDNKVKYPKKAKSFSAIKDILDKNDESQSDLKPTELAKQIYDKFQNYHLLIDHDSIIGILNNRITKSPINKKAANSIFWIHKLKSVVVYPILMAGLEEYSKNDFAALATAVLKWFFINRTIRKREPRQLESDLAEITYKIRTPPPGYRKKFPVKDVKKELLKSTDMDAFNREISEIEFDDAAVASCFLTIIEYGRPKRVRDNTLEHIMPKNIRKKGSPWLKYINDVNPKGKNQLEPKEIHKKYRNRLGNLTLLEEEINKGIQDELFPIKLKGIKDKNKKITRPGYNESHIKITLKICKEPKEDWTIKRIEARQQYYAKLAKEFWQI